MFSENRQKNDHFLSKTRIFNHFSKPTPNKNS
jgi:hypothetical protein